MTTFIYSSATFLNVRNAIVLFLFALNPCSLFSQNLVPNPSFEELDICPYSANQVEFALGWKTIYHTPDYFNSCSNYPTSIPRNYFGFQLAKDTNDYGYVGIVGDFQNDFREIIGISLSDTLEIGKKYYFSFYINAAFNTFGNKTYNCFTDKIGIKFITSYIDTIGLGPRLIDNKPMLFANYILTDTANWNFFSGNFIADSAYTFILIGNFFTNENIKHICQDSNSLYSYTYIDHLCLSNQVNYCFTNSSIENGFLIYPNPTSGQFTIEVNYETPEQINDLTIFNSIGQIVFNNYFLLNTTKIDLSNFSKGVYLIKVNERIKKIILL